MVEKAGGGPQVRGPFTPAAKEGEEVTKRKDDPADPAVDPVDPGEEAESEEDPPAQGEEEDPGESSHEEEPTPEGKGKGKGEGEGGSDPLETLTAAVAELPGQFAAAIGAATDAFIQQTDALEARLMRRIERGEHGGAVAGNGSGGADGAGGAGGGSTAGAGETQAGAAKGKPKPRRAFW